MTGIYTGLSLGIASTAIGQTQPAPMLSLTSLNTELRNLNSDEASRALIVRLFGAAGNANLPDSLTGYNRTTLTSIFHSLKGILLNRNINVDNATRARGFRFLATFATGITEHMRVGNPFDESIIMFDQYSEAYTRVANSLESISRIPTTARTGNSIRVPVGTFANLPYNELPQGVTFNAETSDVRSLINNTLISAVNSVPQNIEIIAPQITEANHEAVERDFEKLQQLVQEMRNRATFLLPNDRQAYSRLLLLCASYADELDRFNRDIPGNNFGQLAIQYATLYQQTQNEIRENAPYTGPELNNANHRLTFLLNRIRTLNTQVQGANSNQARNALKRTFIMDLFGEGTPNCPRVEDFFHRSTSTGVFYDLLRIVENLEVDIPVAVRVRALRFLSTYANNLADYTDRNRQGQDTDPSTLRFLAYGTTLSNYATTIENLTNAEGQIENTNDLYIRFPIGTFLGLHVGADSSTHNINVSSRGLNGLTSSMLVRFVNDAWDRRGKLFSASTIRTQQDLEKAIREFNNLRNLAGLISANDNASAEEKRALSHIWRICNSYAISIMTYHSGSNQSQSSLYGQLAIDCTCEAHLHRSLPAQPQSETTPPRNLSSVTLTPNASTIRILLSRATTPQAKIEFARRLFESATILLAPPTSSFALSAETFTGIRNILEDSTLDININTRTRGLRFLSNYARNYAQTFPEGNETRRLLLAYATACEGAVNQLGQQDANVSDILAGLRPLSIGSVQVAQLPAPPPVVNQPIVQPQANQPPPLLLNQNEGPTPIPAGNVGNVELTLQGGQVTELTSFASGLPTINQRLTYQHVITFNHPQLIPHANITHSGENVQRATNTNQNVTSTNIPGVCYIYSRRNPDGTYTYLIGVYRNYRGTISIGNRQAFSYQAPEQVP